MAETNKSKQANASIDLAKLDQAFSVNSFDKLTPNLKGLGAAAKAMKIATGLVSEHEKLTLTGGISKQLQDKFANPLGDSIKRIHSLSTFTDIHPSLGGLGKQIVEQQRLIDSLKGKTFSSRNDNVPSNTIAAHIDRPLPIKIPPNPIHETNSRLESIEKRFDQIHQVAVGAADIANGLQGAAAEFLSKFTKAANNNDRAASKAILLGALAVLVAIFQIGYNEFYRAPANSEAMQNAIIEMKTEISALREQQTIAVEGLSETLNKSDDALATAILQLTKQLSKNLPQISSNVR